jgi:Na+-driven multidrug efflux pump
VGIIQWAAIFMLGNMVFKKHKTGKTFASYLGISYVLSTIFGLTFLRSNRLEQWMETLEDFPKGEMIRIAHNGMIWGMIIGIIITAVLLYFTYRKIKTQKY